MMKIKIITGVLFLMTLSGFSQSLYQPRDLKEAYQNNTRDTNGKPGINYWQNRGVYNIDIRVTPPQRTVFGSENITYTNNSPDTLSRLNFKLFLNNHKPGAARLSQVGEDYLTSGMHIDSFKENGEASTWKDLNDGTNKFINLKEPLLPSKSVNLSIEWHYDVSIESGREGAIDSTTFFLAYFFPRVAVYDDYSGWDTMIFTGSQEFYNDFNDYTFSVTVPKNYIVWATGDLLNPEEVLQPKYSDKLEKSMTSDQVIRIATPEDLAQQQITKQSTSNTWKWKADSITDIAIAISDHYNWDGGSVIVDEKTGRRASVQAAYNDDAQDFHQMVDFGKHSLEWFSNNSPGVPYPYQKSTIVRGFADMEYPMMVNDNSTPNPDFSRFVVEHEIAHTYFPFYMGINETRYGFMDEGWATALEYMIGINDLGEEAATRNFQMFRVNRWANDANAEEDIPIITPSNILTGVALGNNEYGKAAIGYLAMKDLLGDELFLKALQGYMARWNGKHPTPWDFFYSFNDISQQNLNWFWNSWFFSNNYIDLAITDVQTKKKNTSITLENIGGMPAPVDVIITTSTGESKTYHYTPEIWKNDLDKTTITLDGEKDIVSISLEGGIFMDADTSNNQWSKE
ncbi:M1 family metallopeptidase [Fulvivirga maritima]|uniref:M1 family metallopeptidase n=1 Tax=Fulvivirga maritima TaxID=2904247 RepID=UPI001F295A78|nr:M1 family metallopeptidase [Fulvivirga maritima]UII27367.1 M1 family metallopeptidase [Fulvivirga maritima]